MSTPLSEWLTRLYPRAWRARYGQEFKMFLEERRATAGSLWNVIGCALYEHLRGFGDDGMSKLQHSLVLTVYAYLAAVTAGVNLVGSVDDTPLANAMRSNTVLSACWNTVAAGSLAALLAVVIMGFPALRAMIRFAWRSKRRDILGRLAFPPCAAVVLLAWIAAVVMCTGWAPSFWDVTGDWTPGANWPSASVRWMLSSVTLIIVAAGLVGSAVSLKQAIERSEIGEQPLARIPAWILAASMVIMAAGAAGWGLFAAQSVPEAFYGRFGMFGASNLLSWMGSVALFIASAVMALRGARRIATLPAE